MQLYKRCDGCTDAREKGDLAEALSCAGCEGTAIIRDPQSYVCNKCGGSLCPPHSTSPQGLVEHRVDGGYSSDYLTDCTSYSFSLCEKCLRDTFETFLIPPETSGMDGEVPYAEDREWMDTRHWRQAGGQEAKLPSGLCNMTKSCQEPARWRHFLSQSMTVEAACDTHRRVYGNSLYVPIEDVEGIPLSREDRTLEQKKKVVDAAMRALAWPAPAITFCMYASQDIQDMVGCPDGTAVLWSPGEEYPKELEDPRIAHKVKCLHLPSGWLTYGPRSTVRGWSVHPRVRDESIFQVNAMGWEGSDPIT